MRQVVVVHGGDSFDRYGQYLRMLKTTPVSLQSFLPRPGWKNNLPRDLGRGWQVLLPQMPNKFNARYREWEVWFERMRPFVKPDVILIGHSQGGIFLAKYLSEHHFPKRIQALILVAAPHSRSPEIGDFGLTRSLNRVDKQCRKIFLLYSHDDPVVPFSEMGRYRKDLPLARTIVFQRRGHFNQPHFPGIVRLVKKLGADIKKPPQRSLRRGLV
ncbi:MAG: alpha/beta fold hydrolase [Candidatus Kerfeldbacteria bacterium]|nr:alpha/beta fold hydrolase [Candidatus Kerfeldbacteria bacterium]